MKMNVGKIQRLSETHENLEVFLKICRVPGLNLSIAGQGHEKSLTHAETELLLPCLRQETARAIADLKSQIESEVSRGH